MVSVINMTRNRTRFRVFMVSYLTPYSITDLWRVVKFSWESLDVYDGGHGFVINSPLNP